MKTLNHLGRTVSVLFLVWNVAFGWGGTGHQIINGNFERFLPLPLQSLSASSSYYVQHASDADSRKRRDPNEFSKHFMDIDYYPEFASRTLTHNNDSLCAEYGSSTVLDKGILPWTIASTYGALVQYMANHDWSRADSVIADLGHYIGDAFQPLHCTTNYNGQMTGQSDIHFRFESDLLEAYQGSISMSSANVGKIDTNALEFAFRVIGESNAHVAAILDADIYAKSIDSQYGSAYYSAMWAKLDTLMNEELQGASEALASLVYSAWLEAGSPSLTSGIQVLMPAVIRVSDVYPNPFNPTARFDISLPANSRASIASVSIYSPLGRLVKSEQLHLDVGTRSIALDLGKCTAGVYFVIIDVSASGVRERKTLKAVLLK